MGLSLLSRYAVFAVCILFTLATLPLIHHQWLWPFTLTTGLLSLIGLFDLLQKRHAVRRNYPILGNIRYLVETIHPEIRQYLLEADSDALPFSRAQRSLVDIEDPHQVVLKCHANPVPVGRSQGLLLFVRAQARGPASGSDRSIGIGWPFAIGVDY